MKRFLTVMICLLAFSISACSSQVAPAATQTPDKKITPTIEPTKFSDSTKTPVIGFIGYWVSPIDKDTKPHIQTYGNDCPASNDPYCIRNWKGEQGMYPEDFLKIMVCPYHEYAWDFWWDHQGENVYAVQGGQVKNIEMESHSTIGVHFIIVDIKPDNWYGANYGHVNINSLVANGILSQDQALRIKKGEILDGGLVTQGQKIGVTGDDCCDFGVLHIGTSYGGFKGIDPAELWKKGNDFPDFIDALPPNRKTPSDNCGSASFVKNQILSFRGK